MAKLTVEFFDPVEGGSFRSVIGGLDGVEYDHDADCIWGVEELAGSHLLDRAIAYIQRGDDGRPLFRVGDFRFRGFEIHSGRYAS